MFGCGPGLAGPQNNVLVRGEGVINIKKEISIDKLHGLTFLHF